MTTQKACTGDFLKAVKDAKTIYVPIFERKQIGDVDLNMIAKDAYKVADGTTLTASGGVGGKAQNATSALFVLTQNIANGSENLPRIQRDELPNDSIYTYEAEVYADGDAAAMIMESIPGMGIELIKIYADGTV